MGLKLYEARIIREKIFAQTNKTDCTISREESKLPSEFFQPLICLLINLLTND